MTVRHVIVEFDGEAVEFRLMDGNVEADAVRLTWEELEDWEQWKYRTGLPDDGGAVESRWVKVTVYPDVILCDLFGPENDDGVCPRIDRIEIDRDSLADYDGTRLPAE